MGCMQLLRTLRSVPIPYLLFSRLSFQQYRDIDTDIIDTLQASAGLSDLVIRDIDTIPSK